MLAAFFLLTLLVGVLEVKGEIDCERGALQCHLHLPDLPGIPGSVEGFNRNCPKHIEYYECMAEFENSCESDPDPDSAMIPDLLAYFRDACDKDSDTHAAIVKHLPCLQSNFDNQDETCKELTVKALGSYVEASAISDEDTAFATHSMCYRITAMIACYIAQVEENCEDGAKAFVFDALRRTKYLEKFCSKQNSQGHLELVEALELNRLMKDRIKELLEN